MTNTGNAPDMTLASTPAGLRYDTGKVRLDLLPPEWIWGLGQVTTAGAEKYEPRNWEKGMAWSKVLGPLLRHTYKWMAGETYDEETGCHHLAMVAWNALALMSYQIKIVGQDDVFPVTPTRLGAVRREIYEPHKPGGIVEIPMVQL